MLRSKSVIKNRIIAGVLTTTLAASILGGVVYFNGSEAYARPTLRGIEELVESHSSGAADTNPSPFTIVEVVPSLADAKMGYLVGGEEPVFEGKSIKDMPSKAERTFRIASDSFDPTGIDLYGNAFSWVSDEYKYEEVGNITHEGDLRSVDIKGDFVEAENGWYDFSDITSDYELYPGDVEDIYDDNNTEGIVLYRKSEAYRISSGYIGNYSFNIREITDATDMPVSTSSGVYNFQYFVASEVSEDTSFSEGIVLFRCDESASGEYLEFAGIVTPEDDHYILVAADGTSQVIGTGTDEVFDSASTYNYYSVQEANELSQSVYAIDTVIDGGPFGVKQGYSRVEGDIYTSTNAPSSKGPYYVASGQSDEYAFIEDKTGHYEFVADYTKTDVYQTVEYIGGFTNSEWFKREVLDREEGAECDNLVIDVVPVTLDNLASKLDSADLVYFAGSYGTQDIDPEVARSVVNKVANDDLPVIVEYSTLSDAVTNDQVNLQKLALSLMQVAIAPVADADAWTAINIDDSTAAKYLWNTVRFYNSDASKMDPVANDLSYVAGTIFVNDDIYTDAKKVVADDFNETYIKAKRDSGFADITAEYEAEKPYIELYDDWSKFNANISKATSIRYILNKHKNRAVIKGELNILDIEPYATSQYQDQKVLETGFYRGGRTITNRYRLVRDTMTTDWMVTNLAEHLRDKPDKIHITQQGTKEFIGKNEDLNATYDMIYIGMDTGLMNTSNIGMAGTTIKAINTVYNFSWYGTKLFDNRVYMHMGDRISGDQGWGDPDKNYHLSGNDITSDKYRDLKEYIEAGYAVILSDSFFDLEASGVSINRATLDSTSNMYKLIRDVVLAKDGMGNYIYYGKSVFRKGALEKTSDGYDRARSTISKYLNISKLTINAMEVPLDSNKDGRPQYIPTNPDGSHTLKFVVELTNDAAVNASNTSYDCKLYLDMDADGKFEEKEILSGVEVDGSSSDRFELKTGNTYTITRNVPDEYVGFLSWKLAFIQNDRETGGEATAYNSVRSAITGFSAVRNEGQRPEIKILQIAPNDVSVNGHRVQPNNLDLSNGGKMGDYYKEVTDFDIKVTKITVAEYIQKADKYNQCIVKPSDYTYYDFLTKYDMVVIGFTDNFAYEAPEVAKNGQNRYGIEVNYPVWWTSKYNAGKNPVIEKSVAYKDSLLAIREYALSGRSLLFTHDLTSRAAFNTYSESGYYANKLLRDVMGMDRYNYIDSSNKDLLSYSYDYMIRLEEFKNLSLGELLAKSQEYRIPEYKSVYDYHTVDGNESSEIIAMTDANIIRSASSENTWGITNRPETASYDVTNQAPKDDAHKETVTAINEGQITHYPFVITEGTSGKTDSSMFNIASTHSQYFQLNLDTDSRDDNTNDDVVVWYTISNDGSYNQSTTYTGLHKYYQALYDDVRNNYYIYSKGNVMYTGAGHHMVSDEKEMKLFVNTIVAAYNSGLHAPKVVFKENPWDSAVNITSTFIPYDPKLTNTEAVTDDDSVAADEGGFIDDKIKVNFKTLNNNFRDSGTSLYVEYYMMSDTGDKVIDGVRYKRLSPSVKIDNGNGTLSSVDANVLANYRVYQATFSLDDFELNNGTKLNKENSRLYIRISTSPFTDSEQSTANESMNSLDITAMKLYDLK